MDFTSLSATRVEGKTIHFGKTDSEIQAFQGKQKNNKRNTETTREVYNAIFGTVEGDSQALSDNIMEINVLMCEVASLTDKDLEMIGVDDEASRRSLLEYFEQFPNQEHSYTQIMQYEEARLYNGIILKRAAHHLECMRSALNSVNYKLKIIPPEDVVIGEKNFASRFVLDALEELKRVTDDIEIQLNILDEKAKMTEEKPTGKKLKKITVILSTALVFSIGFLVWKSVRSK